MKMTKSSIAVLALFTSVANGAVCNFTGVINTADPYGAAGVGDAIQVSVTFATAAAATSPITAATLTVNDGGVIRTWTRNAGGAADVATITNNIVGLDVLQLGFDLNPSGGFAGGLFNLTLVAPDTTITSAQLTAGNLAAMKSAGGAAATFNWTPGLGVDLSGGAAVAAAVPEPGSVVAMACIGLCFAGRAYRRRKNPVEVTDRA